MTLDLADPADIAARRSGSRAGRLVRRSISRVRKATFRAAYRVARPIARRTGPRVLFASDSRAELGGNLQVVWDRMVARGLDREYDMLTLFKPSIADHRSFRDRFRMPWLLATADVILVDDYMPVIYRIDDPEVRIVQLWHASGAFKTVGYSRVGKAGGPSPYSRIHKNYTHAIVSDHDVPFYAEAFGVPEARVVPTGILRMDRFFDEAARAEGRDIALAAFPAAKGRSTTPLPRPSAAILAMPRIRTSRSTSTACTHSHSSRTRWSSSRCTRSCAITCHTPEALNDRLDRRHRHARRRQRLVVRGGPAHHRLFVDRVRVLHPRTADAVLRVRPRRVHRRARLLRPVRSVRAGAHRADVGRIAGPDQSGSRISGTTSSARSLDATSTTSMARRPIGSSTNSSSRDERCRGRQRDGRRVGGLAPGRIFTVGLRGAAAGDVAGHIRLTRSGRPVEGVPPVAEAVAIDTVTLRFDLMRGPRRQPLGPGDVDLDG